MIERLSVERDSAKKLARQEIEAEKRELEEKIASLYQEITQNNASKDASMAQLHSRSYIDFCRVYVRWLLLLIFVIGLAFQN